MLKKKKTVNPYRPKYNKYDSNSMLRGGPFGYTPPPQGKRSHTRTCCYVTHYSGSIGFRICLRKRK